MDIIIETEAAEQSVTEADLYRSLDFFAGESDRAAVLTVCAIIDRMLANLLASLAASGKPKVVDALLHRHGAFATVAAKIDWLASIGLINEAFRSDLHRLEALRIRCAAEWSHFAFDGRVEQEVLQELWARRSFAEWCPTFLSTGGRERWTIRERFLYFVCCQIAVINRLLVGDGGRAGARRRRWLVNVKLIGGRTVEVYRTLADVERCLYQLALDEAVRLGLEFKLTKEATLPAGEAVSTSVERKRRQRTGTAAFATG